MTRVLPSVYVEFHDYSTIPEGVSNLSVGYVLASPRGPIGKAELVTSPTDFLSKYTLTGSPSIKDDRTFWSILQVLKYTNEVYISRAAANVLYGGLTVGEQTSTTLVTGVADPESFGPRFADTDLFLLTGIDGGTYNNSIGIEIISSIDNPSYFIDQFENEAAMLAVKPFTIKVYDCTNTNEPILLEEFMVSMKPTAKAFDGSTLYIDTVLQASAYIKCVLNDRFKYTASTAQTSKYTNLVVKMLEGGVGDTWKVLANDYAFAYKASTAQADKYTDLEVKLTAGTLGDEWKYLADNVEEGQPQTYSWYASNDVTTKANPITIVNFKANQVNYTLAEGQAEAVNDTITVTYTPNSWYASGDETTKENPILFADFKTNIVNYTLAQGQTEAVNDTITVAYEAIDRTSKAPKSTGANKVLMGGGSNADLYSLTAADAVRALSVFEDKTIPISLFGGGTGTLYENPDYQQALIELSRNRQDFLAVLNSREKDEKATSNSVKAQNIVNYKKGKNISVADNLGSTYWGACMYAPHVNYSDIFNSRTVKVGTDGTAIAGWLNTILTQGYPYAYAGPSDGLVTGVTCDWKIGDTSGEATALNDASVNYIAYDAKVGRYYMQCQNTLQIANSSLRNIGAVLNILDIKQTFMEFYKEYLQKPITTRLREEMWNKGNDYLKNSILAVGRCVNYSFADITTDADLADNTLRFSLSIFLTPYAQKINLAINIVSSNFDFSITQG